METHRLNLFPILVRGEIIVKLLYLYYYLSILFSAILCNAILFINCSHMQQEQDGQNVPAGVTGDGSVSKMPTGQTQGQKEMGEAKKGGSKKVLIILAAVFTLLILGGGGVAAYYFLVKKPSDTRQAQEAEDEDVEEVEEGEHGEAEEVEDEEDDEGEDQEEEEEEEAEADPYAGWQTFNNTSVGVSFQYPSGWTVTDSCQSQSGDCGIEVNNGNYIWSLMVDPFTTGGGFGFLLADLPSDSPSVYTVLSPSGYSIDMLNGYRTSAWVTQMLGGQFTVPDGDLWVNSVSFSDREDLLNSMGFGPGQMYDSQPGNFFSIMYSYDIQGDYGNLRVKGSAELVQMLSVMDLMTNSVVL